MKEAYILLDVGGTQIKGSVADETGNIRSDITSFPAHAREKKEKIFDNFAFIINNLMSQEADATVVGVGMAFPGPFDYERGISLLKGLNKYDSIYGISIEEEIKKRIPKLEGTKFWYLHDVESVALGESWYGEVAKEHKFICLCIGTGAGTAFVKDKVLLKEKSCEVPENGWIFGLPYKESVIDDYLSVRGLAKISKKIIGKELSGKELSDLCMKNDDDALEVYREFGKDLVGCLRPFLESFKPDAIVIGGQISKSFAYFGQSFKEICDAGRVKIYLEEETSIRVLQGLLVARKEGIA